MSWTEFFVADLELLDATAGKEKREVYERDRAEVLNRVRRSLENLYESQKFDEVTRDRIWREASDGVGNDLWVLEGRYSDLCLRHQFWRDKKQSVDE